MHHTVSAMSGWSVHVCAFVFTQTRHNDVGAYCTVSLSLAHAFVLQILLCIVFAPRWQHEVLNLVESRQGRSRGGGGGEG